jgi:hypothetical protein
VSVASQRDLVRRRPELGTNGGAPTAVRAVGLLEGRSFARGHSLSPFEPALTLPITACPPSLTSTRSIRMTCAPP